MVMNRSSPGMILQVKDFQNHGDLRNHVSRHRKTGPSWLHIGACPSTGWILVRPVVNGREYPCFGGLTFKYRGQLGSRYVKRLMVS